MTIVLRGMTREAAEAILAGERPGDVRVVDDYPTEFSAGVARALGAERQFGSFLLHRSEDDFVVGEIGAAFIDEGDARSRLRRRRVAAEPRLRHSGG